MNAGAELCLRFILQLDFDFAFFQINCCTRNKRFFAAASVFYMYGLVFAVQHDMGDEAVGTGEKYCFVNVLVLHKGIIAEMINK